jgi:hypothetical protein
VCNTIINDTLNWRKIEGVFVATGTEKYITIGNFYDVAHTATVPVTGSATTANPYSHYLIDDVLVMDTAYLFAGNDTFVYLGDSAFIGPHESGLPYTWYVQGSTTPIGKDGGIWVKPSATTSYVLAQDIMGVIKYDTVQVAVIYLGLTSLTASTSAVSLYPNPASNEITIEGAGNSQAVFYDITGRVVIECSITSNRQTLDISKLPKGFYTLHITNHTTAAKTIRKITKE